MPGRINQIELENQTMHKKGVKSIEEITFEKEIKDFNSRVSLQKA